MSPQGVIRAIPASKLLLDEFAVVPGLDLLVVKGKSQTDAIVSIYSLPDMKKLSRFC